MVGNISRRIIARLRNRQFFSLYEINQAIEEEINRFLRRAFQKIEGNRLTAFEKIDKPLLLPLPKTRYEFANWKETKVQFNYHVDYEGFFYSVPYTMLVKNALYEQPLQLLNFILTAKEWPLIREITIHINGIQRNRSICRKNAKRYRAGVQNVSCPGHRLLDLAPSNSLNLYLQVVNILYKPIEPVRVSIRLSKKLYLSIHGKSKPEALAKISIPTSILA